MAASELNPALADGIGFDKFSVFRESTTRRVIKKKRTRGQSHDGDRHDGGDGECARVKKEVADLDAALRHEFLTCPSQARPHYTVRFHNIIEILPADSCSKKSGRKGSGRSVRG